MIINMDNKRIMDLLEKYDDLNFQLIKTHEHYDYLANTFDEEEFEEIRTLKDAANSEINNIKAEIAMTSGELIGYLKDMMKDIEPQQTKKSVLEKLNDNKRSIQNTEKNISERQIESRGAER